MSRSQSFETRRRTEPSCSQDKRRGAGEDEEEGINPVLKAGMDEEVYKKGEGKGLWAKVARTVLGNGWIR